MDNLVRQPEWERRGENEARISAIEGKVSFRNWAYVESGSELYLKHIPSGDMAPISKAPIWTTLLAGAPTNGSTTSAGLVDYPGPVSVTVNKQITNSVLLVAGSVSLFASAAQFMVWGVNIGGANYDVGGQFLNTTGVHWQIFGNNWVASGLAAGSYTLKVRWRTVGGAQANTDGNDRAYFTITEWPL